MSSWEAEILAACLGANVTGTLFSKSIPRSESDGSSDSGAGTPKPSAMAVTAWAPPSNSADDARMPHYDGPSVSQPQFSVGTLTSCVSTT